MKISELLEARGLAQQNLFDELCTDFGMFISLNMAKIDQDAVDVEGKKQLSDMQKHLRAPAINGETFAEAIGNKKLTTSPTGRAAILKWIYEALVYIEPRLKKFLTENGKRKFLARLDAVKQKYKDLVAKQ